MDWIKEIKEKVEGATPTRFEPTFKDEVWFIHHLEEIILSYRQDMPRLIAEVENLRSIILQHHDWGYIQRAAQSSNMLCEICAKDEKEREKR